MEAKLERVLADLHALRAFGRYKTCVHRPTLSPQGMEARRWLVDRPAEIGHEPFARRSSWTPPPHCCEVRHDDRMHEDWIVVVGVPHSISNRGPSCDTSSAARHEKRSGAPVRSSAHQGVAEWRR